MRARRRRGRRSAAGRAGDGSPSDAEVLIAHQEDEWMDFLIDLHKSIESYRYINLLFYNLVSPLFCTFALLSYVAVYRFVCVYCSTV